MTDRRGYSHRGRFDDQLAVLCWCEAKVVYVFPEDVKAGVTLSCGARNCHDRRHAAA